MNYRKKLIEVALPLDTINDASAYDKMPGIGPHPKGIHQWWARLPLPTARAILFASLIDDPSSDPQYCHESESVQDKERERLFKIMRSLLQKKIHEKPEVFEKAYAEIVRSCGDNLPTMFDPFSGGGSIPLEAQRLGLSVQASDLNPVAVIITKALVEIAPKFVTQAPVHPKITTAGAQYDVSLNERIWIGTHGLAEDLRFYGQWIHDEAHKHVGHLYPKVRLPQIHGGNDANVIAWLWARTIQCPNPICKVHMPLVRSYWLSSKKDNKAWIEPHITPTAKEMGFVVKTGQVDALTARVIGMGSSFVNDKDKKVKATFKCTFCKDGIAKGDYIDSEADKQRMGVMPLAIVAEGKQKRLYLAFDAEHTNLALAQSGRYLSDPSFRAKLPSEPARGTFASNAQGRVYGFKTFADFFTARQLVALKTLYELVGGVRQRVLQDAHKSGMIDDGVPLENGGLGATAYADAIATFLALALDRCVDFNNSLCRWSPSNEKVMNLFARQAIPMVWDFAEANILGDSVGAWITCCDYVAECLEVSVVGFKQPANVYNLDVASTAGDRENLLVSTDPPYYDNIGYADLSDFFYVWLRRTLNQVHTDLFGTVLVPKFQELIATPYRFDGDKEKAKQHFESGFRKAFTLLKEKLDPRFPMTVYYAFKQNEESDPDDEVSADSVSLSTGWEPLLEPLISTGFQITATWPVRASQKWRMVSMGSNALASYIVLACRPRPDDTRVASRRDFITDLKRELPSSLSKLQQEAIAPVDLAQAAIGPGMAVFSRYSQVLEADGSSMRVRTALALINQGLDEFLAEQEGEFDSHTRWALAWFEQFGHNEDDFGVAETLSKAKNTSIDGLVRSGVLSARAGKVRLLKREELDSQWTPEKDTHPTIWEATQFLIRALDREGEDAAANLLRRVKDTGEAARDLAYRLYSICERKAWAQEALAYNMLASAWPRLLELAGQSEKGKQEVLL